MQTIRKGAFICCCLIVTICAAAQTNKHEVVLQGKMTNNNNQVLIEDMSEFQYLLPAVNRSIIIPDTTGSFHITMKVQQPAYFRIGRNILYLTPGDSLDMLLDLRTPENSVFRGKGMEANNYLRRTPFPKAGSYAEGGSGCKETPQASVTAFKEKRAERDKELQALTGVSPEFKRLEAARNRADLIMSLKAGEIYCLMKLKLKGEDAKQFSIAYNALAAPEIEKYSRDFVDPSMMQLVVYRDLAQELAGKSNNLKLIRPVKDWYLASDLVNQMQKTSDKQVLKTFAARIDSIATPAYKKAAFAMMRHLAAFGKGDTAIDFTATDQEGKTVNLSDFKGKVIYVDLWATWCGPCTAEMPGLKKLKEAFKNNPDVIFLSVSIDDDNAYWKSSLVRHSYDGYQWIIDRNKLQAYNVTAIPRTLLIDKQFKVADMSAPLPSDVNTSQVIQALLKNAPTAFEWQRSH